MPVLTAKKEKSQETKFNAFNLIVAMLTSKKVGNTKEIYSVTYSMSPERFCRQKNVTTQRNFMSTCACSIIKISPLSRIAAACPTL